jgi:ribonuclease P protein component
MLEKVTYTFSAAEKLKRKADFDDLFRSGSSFFAAPLKVYYTFTTVILTPSAPETTAPPQAKGVCKVGFSVPKKLIKKAVHRNRVKRLLREAYRLHKHKLIAALAQKQHAPLRCNLFFVYTDTQLPPYRLVEEKMKYAIRRLVKTVEGKV